MNIKIRSREEIEKLLSGDFPKNTAVISFYDPPSKRTPKDCAPIDFSGKCDCVYYVCIPDIDIGILEDYGLTYDTYLADADELARFICKAEANGMDIICQCEYGQSRSAACAAAILEHFYRNGISVFADYRYYPNQLVYNKVKRALDKERLRRGE